MKIQYTVVLSMIAGAALAGAAILSSTAAVAQQGGTAQEARAMLDKAIAAAFLAFFRALRIYLTHFRGQASTIMQFVVPVAGTEAEAWDALTTAVGVKGLTVGRRWVAPAGVPAFAGVAEYYTESPYDALLRLDEPGPGIAALGAFNCGGPSMVALNFYLYGDRSAETVARETPFWDAWFQKHFPMPAEPT